jgi:hypothetical protein
MKKSSTQSRKPTPNIYPPDSIVGGAADTSAAIRADNDQDLAKLVRKHFQKESSEALAEIQDALGPEEGHPKTAKSQKE